jgi:hypothetical protein
MAKIAVQNVLRPGSVTNLDAAKYAAMRNGLLQVVPPSAPGATVAELQGRVLAHLPESLFPGGARAGWWFKAVQLDLEANGVIAREHSKPLRLHSA